jgi:transposase
MITITNTAYINTASVCELLDKITSLKSDMPISLILDNARYQRNKAVIAYAELLKIDLEFLPSYSPNLNLIERLWKFVKKQSLYSKYYNNFSLFTEAITECLFECDKKHKSSLDTLLTLNFQKFDGLEL